MPADTLSSTFTALAHPARRAILSRLALGEASVQELSEPLAISAPGVSKHLKILERSGLISRGRIAQRRPCRLEPRALHAVGSWMDELRAATHRQLDQLEAYLADLQGKPTPARLQNKPAPAPARKPRRQGK